MTTAYDTAAAGHSKQVQWLVEIDLDRCNNSYTSAPCTASDAGDGSRCFYSFFTCQDQANYVKTTRTYRFCLNEVPWPDPATAVYPLLKRFVAVPQKVDPSKLFVYPEKLSITFALDHSPPAADNDKTLHNTSTAGEFWHNLFARNRNYPGRSVRIKRGFNASGLVLADFAQVGPTYKIKGVRYTDDECIVECESPLAELNKRQIPFSISQDNTVQDASGMTNSQTTVDVVDASEFPDPADYSRNTLYIKIENEIMSYTTRDTGTNQLSGLTRGAFGTSAATHANGTKVSHVACFGTSAGAAVNAIDTIRDLLEWAGIAAADVNTTSFDNVKAGAWPNDDVLRTVSKSKKISKLVQELREIRGVIIYIDADGKFAAAVMGPNDTGTTYTDDYFLEDSVEVSEDEEARITRVSMYYSPNDDSASNPEDFAKVVIVINVDLENANNFGDVRDETVYDLWTDPSIAIANVRNIARRVITRRGYGVRSFTFEFEVKDGALNVGDECSIQTRKLTNITGDQDVRPVLVTAKRERGLSRIEYEAVDTNYNGDYYRIGPDTMAENYDSATEDDKQYGYDGDNDNRLGTVKVQGKIFW